MAILTAKTSLSGPSDVQFANKSRIIEELVDK
jgi:hypothetical protein